MIQFQEKIPDIQRKGGQTLFHRTLPATAGGSTSATAVDWSQKFRVQCRSNQKLFHHSHPAKNQLNS